MNKGTIIGSVSATFIVLSCAIGGAVFAINTDSSNTSTPKSAAKTATEEVKKEVKVGWNQENGSWYSYKNNEKQTEWVKDNNSWYYLGNDGKMRTGWIKNKDQWYYLNGDGTMATNVTIDGCYLNNEGLIEETPTKPKQSSKSSETNTNDNITYKTYTNERFGFSINYPSNLIPGNSPTNGDGLEFKSADCRVTLGVWGSYNALSKTIEDSYSAKINSLPVKPAYTHLNSNSYILSWEENGIIHYSYSILGKSCFNGFSFTYPASEKDYYSNVVDRIYSSFKTPRLDDM